MQSEDIVAMDFAAITRAIIVRHPNGAFIAIFCGRARM